MKQLHIKFYFLLILVISSCFYEKEIITKNYNIENHKPIRISDREIFVLNIDNVDILNNNKNIIKIKAKETYSFIAYFSDTIEEKCWNNILPTKIVEFENVTNPTVVKPFSGTIFLYYKINDVKPYNNYSIVKLHNVKFKYKKKVLIFNNILYFPSDTACFNAGLKIQE